MADQETLLEFPCEFPIKVMGDAHADFTATMLEIVRQHVAGFDDSRVEMRPSSTGKYLSLTITVTASSKPQLDGLYRALSGHPMVKVVL